MGAWGTAIYSDDIALEIRDTFKEIIIEGFNEFDATEYLKENNKELLDDPEDSCVFWLSLALTQWKLGRLLDEVKDIALKIIDEGTDIERWVEDVIDMKKREKVLKNLKEQLLSPQPPKKIFKKRNSRPKNYKIGDVFLIPFEDETLGAGRILKMSGDTVFVELYIMKPLKDKSDFDLVNVGSTKQFLMQWCFDDMLKNRKWEIVHNKSVDEFKMPYFWTQDAYDNSFILIKGTDDYSGEITDIKISKEETKNYPSYGISSPHRLPDYYFRRLKEMNIIK